MIKTFIFDLGNVVISYDHNRIVSTVEQHCDYSADEIFNSIFLTQVVQGYDTGRISSVEFFDELKKIFSLRMTFDEFGKSWNSTFDLEPILSEELIKQLSEKYRLLVLSDTNDLHFEYIKEHFPILRYFDDFVLSYQTGFTKPSKEIFQIAVEKVGCLAEECFFTDDREGNVAGAIESGINAFQFISPAQFEAELKTRKLL